MYVASVLVPQNDPSRFIACRNDAWSTGFFIPRIQACEMVVEVSFGCNVSVLVSLSNSIRLVDSIACQIDAWNTKFFFQGVSV